MSNDTQKPTIEELLAILIRAYEWEGIHDREYLADMNTRDKMHFADWATFIIQELHESNFEIKTKTPEPTDAQIEAAARALKELADKKVSEMVGYPCDTFSVLMYIEEAKAALVAASEVES